MTIDRVDLGKSGRRDCTVGLVQIATPEQALDQWLGFRPEHELAQLRRILPHLAEAVARSCEVLVLPEYATSANIVEALVTATGSLWKSLSAEEREQYDGLAASLQQRILVAGSYACERDGARYNVSPIIAFGQRYEQAKLALTRPERDAGLHRGQTLRYFTNSGFGNFLVLICYDFTDISKLQPLKGYVDGVWVITRNKDVGSFSRIGAEECWRFYSFIAIANDSAHGGTVLCAPFHGNRLFGTMTPGQEGVLVEDWRIKGLHEARSGNAIEPFKTPPADIGVIRKIPQQIEFAATSSADAALLRLTISGQRAVLAGYEGTAEAEIALPTSVAYRHALWRLAQPPQGRLRQPTAATAAPISMRKAQDDVGRELFAALFPGKLGELLLRFFYRARERQQCPVLQIVAAEPQWLGLPFELLCHPEYGFLCLRGLVVLRTPQRVLDSPCPEPGSPPLDVLMLASAPEGQSDLDYEREQKVLLDAFDRYLQQLKLPATLHFVEDGALEALERWARELEPQVVHLSGHGGSGEIVLEDKQGNGVKVKSDELGPALTASEQLRLIVVSACKSGEMLSSGMCASLLDEGVPMALGMQRAIGDKAATLFAGKFYLALAQGKNALEALEIARRHLDQQATDDEDLADQWWIPTLYGRGTLPALVDRDLPPRDLRSVESFEIGPIVDLGNEFVGRRHDLRRLRRHLADGKRVLELVGFGGIGKSSLAARLAHGLHREGYQVVGLSGKLTPGTILENLQALAPEATAARLTSPELAGDFRAQLRWMLQAGLNRKKAVLILDNFEDNQSRPDSGETGKIRDPQMAECLQQLIEECLGQVVVLFTTRYPTDLIGRTLHPLQPFDLSDFRKKVERLPHLRRLSAAGKHKLYRVVGGHPRLLDLLDGQVASRAQEPAIIEWRSPEELQQDWQVVEVATEDARRRVMARVFLERLWDSLGDDERRLLQAAAMFRVPMEEAGIAAVLEAEVPRRLFASLWRRSLLVREEQHIFVHRTVAAFALDSEARLATDTRRDWHRRAAGYHWQRRETTRSLEDVHEARHHYLEAGDDDRAAEMAFAAEYVLRNWGQYREAAEINREVLATRVTEANRARALHNGIRV